MLLGHDALHALQLLAFVGDFACRAVVLHHVERIAGLRCAVQSQHLYRRRGAGGIDLLAVLVEHGLHAARVGARQDHVAHVERTALHEDRRDVPAALVERRFDDRALRLLVGVGLQVEHLGFEQHLFEQFVEVKALLGRNLLILVFTAPRLHQIVHLRELLLDVVGVGVGLVDLVDGEDHRHACGLRMVDGLDRLRHDAVVGRHDDDRDVRYGGTAGTHGREGFVARRIEERDLLAVELDTVRTDVLRDTPGLAFDDVGFADVVQQRGLTVVDVSHDRDDRRTGHEVFLLVFALVVDGLLDLDRDKFDLVAELLGDHDERFGVEALVDGDHQSQVHAGRDDLRGRHVHHRRQLAHGHELRDFEGRAFLFLAFELFVHTLGNGVAFILAVFGTLAFGTLGRQACQGVLYLLRNLLVAHFGAYDRLGCGLAFVFVAAAFARFGLVLGAGTVLPALSGTVLAALAPCPPCLLPPPCALPLGALLTSTFSFCRRLRLCLPPATNPDTSIVPSTCGPVRVTVSGRKMLSLGRPVPARVPGLLRAWRPVAREPVLWVPAWPVLRVLQVQREQRAAGAGVAGAAWLACVAGAGCAGRASGTAGAGAGAGCAAALGAWAGAGAAGAAGCCAAGFQLLPSGRGQPWVWATGRSCRGTSAAGFRP